MQLLRKNIGSGGRLIRAGGAVALGLAAAFTWAHSHTTAVVLGAVAAFVAFEAGRGWCALRACGVKTKF
jgi:hypothetical protein